MSAIIDGDLSGIGSGAFCTTVSYFKPKDEISSLLKFDSFGGLCGDGDFLPDFDLLGDG